MSDFKKFTTRRSRKETNMGASFNKPSGGQPREQIAEGTYAARAYGIAELGIQTSEYLGEVKQGPEILFFFEIPSETITYEKDGETVTAPRVINMRLKNSMHEKAKMRGFLSAWRGKPFTDEEAAKFSPDKVIGTVCQLSIAHNKKGYANISSIAPLMKGIQVDDQVNPTINFGISDLHNPAEYDKLYPWVQKIIAESAEYKSQSSTYDVPEPVIERGNDEDDLPF